MPGSSRLANSTGVVVSSWSPFSISWGEVVVGSPAGGPPALSTRMSTCPNRPSAASATVLAASADEASAASASTRRPVSAARLAATSWTRVSSRAQISTSQPSCARRRAAASPRPELPPPTTATRPSSPRSIPQAYRAAMGRVRPATVHTSGAQNVRSGPPGGLGGCCDHTEGYEHSQAVPKDASPCPRRTSSRAICRDSPPFPPETAWAGTSARGTRVAGASSSGT